MGNQRVLFFNPQRVIFLFLAGLCCAGLTGCDESVVGEGLCTPNETNACVCLEGEEIVQGVQTCDGAGSQYGECVCSSGLQALESSEEEDDETDGGGASGGLEEGGDGDFGAEGGNGGGPGLPMEGGGESSGEEGGEGIPSEEGGEGIPSEEGGEGIPTEEGGEGIPTEEGGEGVPSEDGGEGIPTEDGGENGSGEGGNIPTEDGGDGGSDGDGEEEEESSTIPTEDGGSEWPQTQGPALKVSPYIVNFGSVEVGKLSVISIQIQSTGSEPLVIDEIELAQGPQGAFALDFSEIAGFEGGDSPGPNNPLIIDSDEAVEVQIRFTPSVENLVEQALITLESNAADGPETVELEGVGVSQDCPVAVIKIQEGSQVIPQTVLNLFGDQSYSAGKFITDWEWTVEQPAGSQSLFMPGANFPNPTFEANTAGMYTFQLKVWDSSGIPSCFPGEANLVVIPDEAIHVELLWNTPNDPDQTDEGPEAGADLDLHFIHPYAAGPDLDENGEPDGWFDQPFDCFWFNPAPQWASFDPALDDDPGLDRDDTDGAGPENLNLNIPENDKMYKVGVHYWADHEYGPSYATVRVYIYSELVFEMEDMKLVNHDMWEVCTIDWPSGTVEAIEDGFKIIPNYENPFFYQP